MPGSRPAPPPPDDLPDEFRAAYQKAYDEALRSTPEPVAPAEPEPEEAPAHVRITEYASGTSWDRWRVPVILGVLALAVIMLAYMIGSFVAGRVGDDEPSSRQAPRGKSEPSVVPKPRRSPPATLSGPVWKGAVSPVRPSSITATCTSKPGIDSAGRPVRYDAALAIDDRADTAWRCDGPAVRERLVLRFDQPIQLAEVGLVPGYAKTDAKSGINRYAENNRITEVRWLIGDAVVVQRISGDAENRSMRTMRVPRTKVRQVTLQISQVITGPRNTSAISAISLGRAD